MIISQISAFWECQLTISHCLGTNKIHSPGTTFHKSILDVWVLTLMANVGHEHLGPVAGHDSSGIRTDRRENTCAYAI